MFMVERYECMAVFYLDHILMSSQAISVRYSISGMDGSSASCWLKSVGIHGLS